MKALRVTSKIVVYLLLTLFVLAGSAAILTYAFKDKIIQLTINELNKHLNAKIEVDNEIGFSIFQKFPHLAVTFRNVSIYESIPDSKEKLASVKLIHLTFDPLNFINQKYVINNLYLEKGILNIKIDDRGRENYLIFKQDTASTASSVSLDLSKISLDSVAINYINELGEQTYSVLAQKALAKLKLESDIYKIGVEGDLYINTILISEKDFFKDKLITINSELEFNQAAKTFTILPSILNVEASDFEVAGLIEFKSSDRYIDLSVNSKHGNIQTIMSLLPQQFTEEFRSYQSEGDVFFKSKIKGKFNEKTNPSINIDFGLKNASIYHPSYKERLTNATVLGYYTNGREKSSRTSVLSLTRINFSLNKQSVKGNFHIENFDSPYVKMNAEGKLFLESIFNFYPVEQITEANGSIDFNIDLQGKSDEIKSNPERLKTSGQITVSNVNMGIRDLPYKLTNLEGDLLFNNNDIAADNFKGKIGKSDFLISGMFRNILSKLLFNKGRIIAEADLESNYLDLEELLQDVTDKNKPKSDGIGEKKPSQEVDHKSLVVYLHCNVKKLSYQKFDPTNIDAQINFQYPWFNLEKAKLDIAGGEITSSTLFHIGKNIEITSYSTLNNIYIDSIFHAFNNFDQEFITDKNIKGQLNGPVKFFMSLDQNMSVDQQSLAAKIEANIKNGQLLNFEPMQKLSTFVEEEELANIKFNELSNTVYIENRNIVIPEMEIKSNVSNIAISGSHTFDNYMDYRLTVPLKNFTKQHKDKDEAYGAVEEVKKGQTVVYLTIKGHADNFKVAYDTKKTKKKIAEDLKKEKKEFLEIFKNKNKDKENPSPEIMDEPQQEFFDFD